MSALIRPARPPLIPVLIVPAVASHLIEATNAGGRGRARHGGDHRGQRYGQRQQNDSEPRRGSILTVVGWGRAGTLIDID